MNMIDLQIPEAIQKEDLIQDQSGKYWFQLPDTLDVVKDLITPNKTVLLTPKDHHKIKFPIMCTKYGAIAVYNKLPIGNGAFGKVYIGQDLETGKFFAVKDH